MSNISHFFHNLWLRCASLSPKTIAVVVLVLIATVSVAIVGMRASQIYSLAVDSTDGFDVDDADVKVTWTGGFLGVTSFMPLVQVFAGTNFNLEGMTTPWQTSSVDIPGIGFELPQSLLDNGWAVSQTYEDENISTALIEDEEGNRAVVATTEPDDPRQLLSDINDQYSDILPIFGFEVDSATFEGDSLELVFTQEDLTLEAQAWIDPEDPDRLYVATFLTDEEDPSIPGADFDEIMALLQGET